MLSDKLRPDTQAGINRNIVECKVNFHDIFLLLLFVLIETLWNVKHKKDTGIPGASLRINRNIVECKDQCSLLPWLRMKVLIETLWNVK